MRKWHTRLRSDPRTAAIPLVALSHNARTARLRSWMDSGFDDFLVKSPQVVPLLKASISELLGGPSGLKREGGLLIPFFSAKGGLGTSSLCANLASCMAAADRDRRVVVMDLVLPMGSIAGIVGHEGTQDLEEMARLASAPPGEGEGRIDLPRIQHWYFRLLSGSPNPEKARLVSAAKIVNIVSILKAEYDVVIVDLGRSLSRISLPLLQVADLIVFVASTDEDSVRLTRTAWDYLRSRGVSPAAAFLLLNRPVQVEGVSKEEVEKAIGLPVRAAIPHLAGNLSLANHWHQPFSLKFPRDPATMMLQQTANDLLAAAKQRREW